MLTNEERHMCRLLEQWAKELKGSEDGAKQADKAERHAAYTEKANLHDGQRETCAA